MVIFYYEDLVRAGHRSITFRLMQLEFILYQNSSSGKLRRWLQKLSYHTPHTADVTVVLQISCRSLRDNRLRDQARLP
jgi:hypothetical protein